MLKGKKKYSSRVFHKNLKIPFECLNIKYFLSNIK